MISITKLWNSTAFRLLFLYWSISISTILLLVTLIYSLFNSALETEYARQIDYTEQRLISIFTKKGINGLASAIDFTLSDLIDSDREVYLLTDSDQKKIAGNIDNLISVKYQEEDLSPALIQEGREIKNVYIKIINLPNGSVLIVGQDLNELNDIRSIVRKATAAAFLIALILVILGAHIFKKELLHRFKKIRTITKQVSAGQLSKRIDTSKGDDVFALLSNDINTMLDRIEVLMKSSRHISDTIAHNIRTPLTRIVGALRGANRPGASHQALLEANQRASNDIDQLCILLEKILQIADIDSGIQRRSFKPCELDHIVSDVIEMHEALAEEKGVSITLNRQATALVNGDANLLASAISNLLDNAIKYSRSTIIISTGTHNNRSLIVIRDDGPGVPAQELENLGKHFYRLNTSTEGYGLGLTSVKGIIHLHGGDLEFSDSNPGLRVTLSIPTLT